MGANLKRSIPDKGPAVVLFAVGVLLVSEPVLDVSRFFPDGLFELVGGIVLVGTSLVLYWFRGSENQ